MLMSVESYQRKGSQMVTVHEPENKIGWTFGYYSFHAVLQRKF